ncbi:MAG: HAD family hydrolase [Xenococcus sp. (in: cyanobacteria)]
MTTVLFWDIDGTLLTTGRAGIFALEDAASEVIGTPVDLSNLKTAGMTDREIATEILLLYQVAPEPLKVQRLLQLYGKYLPASLPRKQGAVLKGVREILDCLQQRTDTISLLLTGNIEAGAKAKLSYYGLHSYFTDGSFADDAEDRNAIAHQALAIARCKVGQVPPEKTYVIGDTPRDISCGKSIQARVVAVASGSYSVEELETHQPWWTVSSLPEAGVFLQKIGLEND